MVRSLPVAFLVRAERNADLLRYPAHRIAWSRCLSSWLRVVVAVVAIATAGCAQLLGPTWAGSCSQPRV